MRGFQSWERSRTLDTGSGWHQCSGDRRVSPGAPGLVGDPADRLGQLVATELVGDDVDGFGQAGLDILGVIIPAVGLEDVHQDRGEF